MTDAHPISQPVLNTPYEKPQRHWELGIDNRALNHTADGRRLSIALLPVPKSRENVIEQPVLPLGPENLNATVNAIREYVDAWRDKGYRGATAVSRRLLQHWRSEDNVPRLFFAQVEALETLIWITEVARSDQPIRVEIEAAAREHNDGIIRYCTKMATGTGKTAVMGMVIAWNVANVAAGGNRRHPGRYFTTFVAVTPGHTVRERLAVLDPSNPDNVYDELSLVPAGMRGELGRVKLRVVNFQAFQCRDRLGDATGDARRLLRRGDASRDPESPGAMLRRVLRGLPERGEVCVLNDEAHHCYLPEERQSQKQDDEKNRAALWFSALAALRDEGRLGRVHDFSATPMFIETAASKKSVMFPWVVSDFPLMDGIESGLVKIPRVPVDDDTDDREVAWRNLYRNTNPKTIRSDSVPPPPLGDALGAMYDQYTDVLERWDDNGLPTPPVFIVVANTIANAEALYHHIAGCFEHDDGASAHRPGAYELFSNIRSDGLGYEGHVRTLLVHSKMEGDDAISAGSRLGRALKEQAEQLRNLGAVGDDRSVIREALNTVGRPGGLGEHVRCVVSVSMLTEGWDTRTVVHILGFRAFGTQLLCEQVTGRALRRSNYDSFDDDGRLTPEFADVLGVPFDFMPVSGSSDPPPPKPRYRVFTMPGRRDLRIEFPALTGYMIEPASTGVDLDPGRVGAHIVSGSAPSMTEVAGVMGESDVIVTVDDATVRHQQIIVGLAAEVTRRLDASLAPESGSSPRRQPRRRRLFMDAVRAVRAWLDHPAVHCEDINWLLRSDQRAAAAQAITEACLPHTADDRIIGIFDSPPVLDTSTVDFETSLTDRHPVRAVDRTRRSELNVAACHSDFERRVALALDKHPDVDAWARNFRLDWTVPYEVNGIWHRYVPDFVVRLFGRRDGDDTVHLMLECKGAPDEVSAAKHGYVQDWWIPAVANSPETPEGLRRWTFAELVNFETPEPELDHAIEQARRLVVSPRGAGTEIAAAR
jgi:type III restriction enzyme